MQTQEKGKELCEEDMAETLKVSDVQALSMMKMDISIWIKKPEMTEPKRRYLR